MRTLVVFDLDGTLVDSQRDLAESANAMLANYGARPLPEDDVTAMVGDGARQLVERALAAARLDTDLTAALDDFLTIYAERLVLHTRPYAGIVEALEAMAGRTTMAVLTNKPTALAERLLAVLDLARFFAWVIGGDSDLPRKPDPAGLAHLMTVAKVPRESTVFVGDSMIDVETGRRAGAHVIVALYGFGRLRQPLTLTPADLIARKPLDIPRLFEAVVAHQARPEWASAAHKTLT